jgi:hypothetical protein
VDVASLRQITVRAVAADYLGGNDELTNLTVGKYNLTLGWSLELNRTTARRAMVVELEKGSGKSFEAPARDGDRLLDVDSISKDAAFSFYAQLRKSGELLTFASNAAGVRNTLFLKR